MNPEENGHGKFQVSLAAVVSGEIKQFLRIAMEVGQEGRFLEAPKQVEQRLENEPGSFGEPLFYLKSLRLEMRLAIVPPFAATFGVNYSARTVFVSKMKTAM
jgi:hypothetical protein